MEKTMSLPDLGLRKLAMLLIRLYQVALSPFLPPGCRFVPSCSEYAREAYERHGFWRGSLLTFARLMRCRPGGGCGYDPVPEAEHSEVPKHNFRKAL